jgi:hypothetical protein
MNISKKNIFEMKIPKITGCNYNRDDLTAEELACEWNNMEAFSTCANQGRDNAECCKNYGANSGWLECAQTCQSGFSTRNLAYFSHSYLDYNKTQKTMINVELNSNQIESN